MVKSIESKEKIAEVKGINNLREPITFKLSYEEVKHLRRLVTTHNFFHKRHFPENYEDKDLNRKLYFKLAKFGRMKKRMRGSDKKEKLKNMEGICSFEDCNEKNYLTLDHKIRLTVGFEGVNDVKNLQLLCPKHHLLKELKLLKLHKEQELEKTILRIEDIELRGTTDCLGYNVLSKDKFKTEEELEESQETTHYNTGEKNE